LEEGTSQKRVVEIRKEGRRKTWKEVISLSLEEIKGEEIEVVVVE
jgi:hypothetical protein